MAARAPFAVAGVFRGGARRGACHAHRLRGRRADRGHQRRALRLRFRSDRRCHAVGQRRRAAGGQRAAQAVALGRSPPLVGAQWRDRSGRRRNSWSTCCATRRTCSSRSCATPPPRSTESKTACSRAGSITNAVNLGALRRVLVRLQRVLAPEPAALFRLLNRPPAWVAESDLQELRQSTEEFSAVLNDVAVAAGADQAAAGGGGIADQRAEQPQPVPAHRVHRAGVADQHHCRAFSA